MRGFPITVLSLALSICGCSRSGTATPSAITEAHAQTNTPVVTIPAADPKEFIGFDRNSYPGDDTMAAMKPQFSFVGYWLTNPPGARSNNWVGKRNVLRAQGWGFLVLANGKLDAEILKAKKAGTSPADLGRKDAAIATAAAKSEGFPSHAVIFLDQEEGGRLTDVQAAYLLAWTEAVAATGYKPGVYASGKLVEDAPGVMIDTIRDIRDRVQKGHLHEIAMFDTQDTCPPAPGCTVKARPMKEAGEPDLSAWQYSQSPREPEFTKACAATYAKNGDCMPPAPLPQIFLDMDAAKSPDPSNGK